MITVVAIDVPPDLAHATADAVTASCQNAIGAGRCVLSEKVDSEAAWYAIVRTDDAEQPRLHIEFRKSSPSGALVAERSLAFSDRDAPESRWASAGLVIAGLVAAEDAAAKASEANDKPHEAPPPPRPELRWGADAGALGGQGLLHGAYRVGAFGRGWIVASSSGTLGAVTLRYAQRSGDASLTWWSLSVGLGARIGSKQAVFNAELIGDVVAERMLASAFDPQTAREDSGGQNRFGGRLGANGAALLTRDLRFLLGIDISAMTPPVDIQVKGTLVGREPAVRFSFTGGLRVDL